MSEFLHICFLFPCINFLDICSQTVLNFSHVISSSPFCPPRHQPNFFSPQRKNMGTHQETTNQPGSTSWSSTFTPWWPIILKSSSQSIAVFTSVLSPKKTGFSQVPLRFFQAGKRWMLSMRRNLERPWSMMVTSFMSLVGDLKCESQRHQRVWDDFEDSVLVTGHYHLFQDFQKPPKTFQNLQKTWPSTLTLDSQAQWTRQCFTARSQAGARDGQRPFLCLKTFFSV